MIRFLLICALAICPLPTLAQEPEPDIRPAAEVVLDDFLWLNRLIVVFSDSPLDPNFREQMDLLAAQPADLAERDVIIVTDTDPKAMTDLRRELRPRGFVWLLIDKDGVIKLRKPTPWHVREIIRSIDKTELRQQEIRERQEAGE